jgi:PKD repeat protein
MIAACITFQGNPTGGGNLPPPVSSFILLPNPAHIGQTVQFLDESTNNPTYWQWTVNGALFSNNKNPTFYAFSPGNFVIGLTTANAFGSNSASPQTLSVS